MNVQPMNATKEQAQAALKEYRAHRDKWDKRDMEIARIYRAISRGKVVISALDAIVRAGLDELGRPRLALMRADQEVCRCEYWQSDKVILTNEHRSRAAEWHFEIPWPNRSRSGSIRHNAIARLPRIPPQHRPTAEKLSKYHILWEADWTSIPRDPYLLRRIGKDAWLVVAAWELSDIEISVLRAHEVRQ